MSKGAGGGFNPDIAPKKKLEIPFETEEEKNVVLQKLHRLLQKTTGRPFSGYIDDIPPSVMRRLESLFAMKKRQRNLVDLFHQDNEKNDREKRRQERTQEFGMNFPFKVLR